MLSNCIACCDSWQDVDSSFCIWLDYNMPLKSQTDVIQYKYHVLKITTCTQYTYNVHANILVVQYPTTCHLLVDIT